ncbi:glycosyltransferase family 2 protein [Xanthomonas sp. NCPPB 2632]|jgi:glycosyltransferase involved in cell wall biosynthesis|uniref:glycosyltransferase family 2 protein n=1 Tax=Xanthomonas sp. NCPPB 2632 TaxID=3240912 RepID=UPI003518D9D2
MAPTPADTSRLPISLCVIAQNEADRIVACLASADFCDDVVVVDGGSLDATVPLAEAAGARVIHRPFDGFRTQKDFAVAAARNDWVLCLDADEWVDPSLRAAILARFAKGTGDTAAFRIVRRNRFLGKVMKHGNAGSDRVVRLFDRRTAGWHGAREIHESVVVKGRTETIDGWLDHDPYRSLSAMLAKQERYAHLMAEEAFARRKRTGLAQIVLSPAFRFLKGYVFRGGFLDGWRGLIYALLRVEYVRRKYVKQYLLQKGFKP